MEYVTKKRIALSERLLVSTDHNLRTVASDCGFADVEYFSRTFKKIKGISPAAWRSINKN
jgi:AraC family transcriptional regulator